MKKVLVSAGVLAAIASAASATTIVQSLSFGPSTPNFSDTLTFNKYAGPASDIVSISVMLTLNVDGGQLELDNDGADPASGSAELGAAAAISSVDVPLLASGGFPVVGSASASNSSPFAIAGDDADGSGFQSGGSDYFNFLGGAGSDMESGNIWNLVFGSYAGGGTFNVIVNASQIFDYGAIGGISFAGSPVLASGTVKIVYEIIPTPGALAVLGLGGLVAGRRRR